MTYWDCKEILRNYGTPEEYKAHLESEDDIKTRMRQLHNGQWKQDEWAHEEINLLIELASLRREVRAAIVLKRGRS